MVVGLVACGKKDSSSEESEPLVLSRTEGIDVDLTILSSTMVYSQVYDMMLNPNDYIGKTYPEDYPEIGSEVTVTGIYDIYYEGEVSYSTLRDCTWTS